jgi:hypothetical protein
MTSWVVSEIVLAPNGRAQVDTAKKYYKAAKVCCSTYLSSVMRVVFGGGGFEALY